MALNADTLLDRLYLKSQITKWRALAVIFAVIAAIVAVERFSGHSPIEGDYIARLSLDGIIGDNQKIYDMIDEVAENPRAKAVILWLDTPGGSAVGGEEIFLRLRALSAQKPVVAVMRSVAASAGYMAALGADHILAREGTITGSIGVLVESAEVTELAEKLGITPIIIKSSPLKGSPSFLEKNSPEAERVIRDVINDFYDRFVDMVAERRKLPRDRVVTLADGRVYSGRGAVAHKLIDGIGGEEEAVKWLAANRQVDGGLDIKDVRPDRAAASLLERFAESLAGHFFTTSRVTLDGLVSIWHPQLY